MADNLPAYSAIITEHLSSAGGDGLTEQTHTNYKHLMCMSRTQNAALELAEKLSVLNDKISIQCYIS